MMMSSWCCNKTKAATHFCTKAQNRVLIAANRATMHFWNINQRTMRMQKKLEYKDKYTVTMFNGAHYKSWCKWITNLRASKHMTFHRAVFHPYEVMAPYNVNLGDNCVIQLIESGSIILKIIMIDNSC